MSNLKTFHQRVQALYRAADPFADGQRPTQEDLSREIGLSRAELSKRLNGGGKVALSCANATAIVRTLAKWEALQTQAQAIDLLALAGCPPFKLAEWRTPPLDQLAPLGPAAKACLERGGNNLPLQLTSFVGRERELAELEELLQTTRLLTITGAGGMGKTRLATELASGLLDQYHDGCRLVSLAPLADGRLVVSAMAHALGVREEPGRPISDTLVDYLRPRRLLLVLDNCEHLLAACAELVKLLLAACADLHILTTSREPLGIAGETEWRLSPLPLPDPTKRSSNAQVQDCPAVSLFVSRAQAALPRFRLVERNTLGVVQICRQLEGIPLALELAAPLVKVLSVEQLARRLEDRLRLLRSSDPTAPTRQQTLRASIEWSYDLLGDAERILLHRLAVFAGGWSLEAAEVICTDSAPHPNLQSEAVLAGHVQLVNKSLVQASEQDGAVRYAMLETVRQFAAELLTKSGEEEQLRQRHAGLYLALAEQAEPELRGAQQVAWLDRLESEYDNIRAALGWLINREPEAGLRLAGTLWQFWRLRGYLSEGRSRLEAVLAQSGTAPTTARTKALHGAAVMAFEHGDPATARSLHETNLAMRLELKDESGIAATLFNLGLVTFDQGDYKTAKSHFEQAFAIGQRLGDSLGMALNLSRLSTIAYVQGDLVLASSYIEEGMAIARQLGEKSLLAELLMFKGDRARREGDYATAQAAHQECLTISRALGDKVWAAAASSALGRLAMDRGDYRTAYDLFSQAIRTQQEAEETMWVAPYLEDFASLAAAQNQAQPAVRLLASAAALREAIGSTLRPFERDACKRTAEAARKQIGAAEFEAAWAAGRRMSVERAIEYALNLPIPAAVPIKR